MLCNNKEKCEVVWKKNFRRTYIEWQNLGWGKCHWSRTHTHSYLLINWRGWVLWAFVWVAHSHKNVVYLLIFLISHHLALQVGCFILIYYCVRFFWDTGERDLMLWKSAHETVWSRFMATFLNSTGTVIFKHFVLKTPKSFCLRHLYLQVFEN